MKTTTGERRGIWTTVTALLAVALFSACVGEVQDAPGGGETASEGGDGDLTTPVATLTLGTGQKLEFFDAGKGALVSESGPAGLAPVWNRPGRIEVRQLLDIWGAASPAGLPAPGALRNLQARLMRQEALRPAVSNLTASNLAATETPFDESPVGLPDGTFAAPQGCSNGCCDFDWLSTFLECQGAGRADFSWFHFKAGTSFGKGDDAFHFRAMACAAQGDSTWRVHIQSGGGGTWTIPEGHYRTIGATGGLFDDPNVGSYVNQNLPPHMHSHCGIIYF